MFNRVHFVQRFGMAFIAKMLCMQSMRGTSGVSALETAVKGSEETFNKDKLYTELFPNMDNMLNGDAAEVDSNALLYTVVSPEGCTPW